MDSIQTLVTERIDGSAGTISQIRECATDLMKFAKESQTPVILIGHINKEGNLAGPKVLEHMVDTVLQFEGDLHHQYRILRASKNRFGSTDELGIFEMNSKGLREVTNPSELLLANRDLSLSGNAISVSMEGQRSLLLETQALVSSSVYGTPQRSTTGFDPRKIPTLLDTTGARKIQTSGACWHRVGYTGVRRLRPTLRRLRKVARPLLLELRAKKPCWRFRRIFDG